MKRFIILIIVIFISTSLFASKVVPLSDILKPETITLDNKQMYITEGTSIYIFSLPDFKFIKKFGKEGEGPQEFKINPQLPLTLFLKSDKLLINSFGKISWFSKDGSFLNEEKVTNLRALGFRPFGDLLVGMTVTPENNTLFRAINIFDSKLNKKQELTKVEHNFQMGKGLKIFKNPMAFATSDDKLFLHSSENFIIDVFNSKGQKLYSITHEMKKRKVTDDIQKEVIHFLKTDSRFKQMFEFLKPIQFPDYFPPIRDMRISDEKLYVVTFSEDEKNEKSQCLIFDLKGKLIKDLMIPLKYKNKLEFSPFTIHDGKLYQVVENIDEEEWELHISEI